MCDHEWTLQIENDDDISMKTKLSLIQFGGNFGSLRLDEKSALNVLLGFTI